MTQDLVLDVAIQNWVLFPLTFIMLAIGILRQFATILMTNEAKAPHLLELREQRALLRANILRHNGAALPPDGFAEQKQHLLSSFEANAYLKDKPEAKKSDTDTPQMDPQQMDGMMDMMKKQAVQFLPQTVLMYWISSFFDGFVLTRLPFPLTVRFKSMLQRGIGTKDMDVAWVSSVSWYFLCLFGLGPVYQLILGDVGRDIFAASMQMVPPTMPGQKAPDMRKTFTAESENLHIAPYEWVCNGVEERLVAKLSSRLD